MYTVDLYLRVRLACHVDGLSQREAASRFGIARETVRKMLRHSEPPGYRRRQPPKRPKLAPFTDIIVDPSRKSGGALHRLHCFCLEFDGACGVQRRMPTDWIIEPVDVSGYGSFSLAS